MNEYWNYICSLKKRENQNFEAGFFIMILALVSKLTRTKLTSGKKIFLKVQRRKVKDKLITNQDSNLLVSY